MKLSTAQLARMSRLLDEVIEADDAARLAWLGSLAPEHVDLEPALRQALFPREGETRRVAALEKLPTLDQVEPAPCASRLQAGELVGPWRLMRPLGSGGMAEVWLAQRADGAFTREVALKIPADPGHREDLPRRFAIERDILAGLEHPHIARFYDAGVSHDGRPWLALEYVAGRNLLQWADEHRLELTQRIELFRQVLEAVQYAHDKGVLHRDIKPGNLLVSDAGQVNLLDFGVARLMERPADAELTRVYGAALTPGYASPEQLKGEGISAASDVYSLGVVLHELLSGRRPKHAPGGTQAGTEDVASAAWGDIAQSHGAMLPPSACVDANAAETRGGSVARLRHVLRGELDAIVLKALAPRPSGRYASAAALARDLRRYLGGEAVQAMPNSLHYKAGKFLRRNRSGVALAVAIAVVMGLVYEVMYRDQFGQAPAAEAGAAPAAPAAPHDKPAPAPGSPDSAAYKLVQQGEVYANGPFERDAQRAEVAFKKAAALEPAYALPWARLGQLHMARARLSQTGRDESNARALEAIDAALKIDPSSMDAHAERYRYAIRVDHRWDDARAELDRMRGIDPTDPWLLPDSEASFAAVFGKLAEAIKIQRLVVNRDPQNAAAIGALARYLFDGNRLEESLGLLQHELEFNPHAAGNHALIAVGLALLGKPEQGLAEAGREPHEAHRLWAMSIVQWMLGRRAESDTALQELRLHPKANAYRVAQAYALRGAKNPAFEWLGRACVERLGGCESLRVDRLLAALRGDPRYRALLVKMRLDGDPPLNQP